MQDSKLEVKTVEAGDARWDAFVHRCDGAGFFHRLGWKAVIERSFGHRTHYLCAERNGDYEGVLPLVHMKSLLFGNFLSSTPFCVYGGVAATSAEAHAALSAAALQLARRVGAHYLELRNRTPAQHDWPTKDLYVTFRKPIDADVDANYKAIPRKQRAMIRKGIDAGLEARITDDVGEFYRLYAHSVTSLGTPVFTRRYLETLLDVFGGDCELMTVYKGRDPVAAVLSFYHDGEVLPYYAGASDAARDVKAHDFMYWELMKRACERGCTLFDYGRSKVGTGSYRFKKHWGFEPEPLYYQYQLLKGEELPNLSPSNRKYKYFVEYWKKLPVPIASALGPPIARHLG